MKKFYIRMNDGGCFMFDSDRYVTTMSEKVIYVKDKVTGEKSFFPYTSVYYMREEESNDQEEIS